LKGEILSTDFTSALSKLWSPYTTKLRADIEKVKRLSWRLQQLVISITKIDGRELFANEKKKFEAALKWDIS